MRYLPELESIAREAGALLMHYFTGHVTIEYKGDVDLVTEADEIGKADCRTTAGQVAGAWHRRGGGHAQRDRRGISLVRRSPRRYHQFRARLSCVLHLDRPCKAGWAT